MCSRNIVLLYGLPGAGKSSVGAILSRERGISYIGVGSRLYDIAFGSTNHPMRGHVKACITAGRPCPSYLTAEIWKNEFRCLEEGEVALLDGYPRTQEDVSCFCQQLYSLSLDTTNVIAVELQVSRDLVMTRLKARGREDDSDLILMKRFEQYDVLVKAAIEALRQRNFQFHVVNNYGPLNTAVQDVSDIIRKTFKTRET